MNEDLTYNMKIAVIYTGALRTIRKTIHYLKRNVLLNPNVHVFACLQHDTPEPIQETEAFLRGALGSHLQSLQWFDIQNYSEWIILREKNLDNCSITNNWKDYLRNSGSMIEYYQLYVAYKQMFVAEQQRSMEYDYIIRLRPDNLFAKPVDFHWLQWTEQDVIARIEKLYYYMRILNIESTPENTIRYFMNTLLDDSLLTNLSNLIGTYVTNPRVPISQTSKELLDYLHHGSYILTFRANNLYIVRRNLFHMIPSLFAMYGLLKPPQCNDPYWFNAENQFQYACLFSGLAIHDYNTLFEDKSLYEYDERRYFDEHYNIINPLMVYCLVRR